MVALGRWTPARLRPHAWYDAHLGGSSTGIVDSSSNARAAMTVGGGSNAAQWLPYARPSIFFPPSASNIITSTGSAHDLSTQTDQSYRFRVKIDSLGSSADTYYALLVQDSASPFYALLPYVANNGVLLFATYDPGYNGSGSLGDITPYLGQWIDLWFKYQHGSPNATVTAYVRTDMTRVLADNTGWTTLLSNTVKAAGSFTRSATYVYSTAPTNGGQVTLNEIAVWLSATPSGNPAMNFKAEGCTQTGYTDPINAHTYFVTRPASGRKAVVQSPAANSAESLFLLGTDDWLDVPAAAIPPLNTFAAPSSVVAVFRRWHNPGAAGHPVFTTKGNIGNAVLGTAVRFSTTAAATTFVTAVGDGTNAETDAVGATLAFGTRGVLVSSVGNVSPFVSMSVNGGAANVDVSKTTTISTTTGLAGRIGAYTGGTGPIDMEFRALLTFGRALNATEIGQLVAFYKGGL